MQIPRSRNRGFHARLLLRCIAFLFLAMRFVCDLLFVGMRNAIDQFIHSFIHLSICDMRTR